MKPTALQLAEDALNNPKTKAILGRALHDGEMAALKHQSEIIDRATAKHPRVLFVGHLLDGIKIVGGQAIL